MTQPADQRFVSEGTLGDPDSVARGILNTTFVAVQSINAADYGYAASNTAAANTTALNAAIAAGMTAGKDVEVPRTGAFGEAIDIAGAINASGPGFIRIYGQSGRQAKIHQTVKPASGIYVTAPGVIVENVAVYGDGLDMTGTGGPIAYAAYAGVWLAAGSDGSTVRNLFVQGMHRAVRIDSDPTTTDVNSPSIRNVLVSNVEGKDCWTVLTYAQLVDSHVTNIRGNYLAATSTDGTDVGQPPHCVYAIDRSDTGRYSKNVQLDDLQAWDGDIGKAFAIKGTIGGSASHLSARNCHGLLDIISMQDFNFYDVSSVDDRYPATGTESAYGSISYSAAGAAGASTRTNIYGANVRFANLDHGKALLLDGTDNVVKDMTAVGNMLTENVAVAGSVLFAVKGQKCRLENPVGYSMGANMRAAITTIPTGQYGKIINPRSIGNFKYGVDNEGHHDVVIEYDPSYLETNGQLNGATNLSPNIKPIVTSGATLRTEVRARDRPRFGPEYVIGEDGQNTVLSGNGPTRATTGQDASQSGVSSGAWAVDAYGRSRSTSSTAGVQSLDLWTTARLVSDTATPNIDGEVSLVYGATNASSRAGVGFRGVDASNFLFAAFTTTAFVIGKLDVGTETILATTAATPVVGHPYLIRTVLVGNVIEAFVDGVKMLTYALTGGDITKYAAKTNCGNYSTLTTATLFNRAGGKRLS